MYFGKESGGQEALQEFQRKQKKQGSQNLPLSGNLEYYRRALVLQEAALFLIHEAVADRIQTTTQQISMFLNLSHLARPHVGCLHVLGCLG